LRPVRPLSHRSSRPDPNPPPLLSHLPPLRAGRGQGQSPRSRRGRQDRRGTCLPPSALPTIRPPRPPEFGSPPPPCQPPRRRWPHQKGVFGTPPPGAHRRPDVRPPRTDAVWSYWSRTAITSPDPAQRTAPSPRREAESGPGTPHRPDPRRPNGSPRGSPRTSSEKTPQTVDSPPYPLVLQIYGRFRTELMAAVAEDAPLSIHLSQPGTRSLLYHGDRPGWARGHAYLACGAPAHLRTRAGVQRSLDKLSHQPGAQSLWIKPRPSHHPLRHCLLYTSDAADE